MKARLRNIELDVLEWAIPRAYARRWFTYAQWLQTRRARNLSYSGARFADGTRVTS